MSFQEILARQMAYNRDYCHKPPEKEPTLYTEEQVSDMLRVCIAAIEAHYEEKARAKKAFFGNSNSIFD